MIFHCPRCGELEIEDQDKNIWCPKCKLTFKKEFLKTLEDREILSNEELQDLYSVLDEFGDINHLKKKDI